VDTTLADPLIGQLLDGRYRVESRIARGGMASVYLALDVRLDRTVAVKVMHRSLAEDPAFVRRFIGEAKSVASLSHPNVVHVFDQGTDGEHVYLSMEYVPGRTLRDVLKDRERLPAREALEVMIPVLAALGAAHQAGLVHRDVKPENVLLADDGRVKVVDFGLARAIEGSTHQTRTGIMIGTIAYMSPEQVTNGRASASSDVYAAGIMLFELVTGRQPYASESPVSVAYKHVHESVPAPSSVVPGIPPLLDTLVAAATAKDPAQRPPDASALLVAAVDTHRMLPAEGAPPPPPAPGTAHPLGPGAAPAPPAPGAAPAPPNPTMIQPRSELLTGPGPMSPARSPARSPASLLRRVRTPWVVVGALAALMVAGIVWSGWYFSQGRYTTVPNLLGKNTLAAQAQAEKLGFKVTVAKAENSDKVDQDKVLRTEPAFGTDVFKGSALTLIPSAGPVTVPVPNVANLNEAAARSKIAEVGLAVGKVSKVASDSVRRGLVVRTTPQIGSRVRQGGKVTLVLSAGLLMPDVTGIPRDQAEQILREKGFDPQFVEQNDNAEPGTVIAQSPGAGDPVTAGATVQLTVAKNDNTVCFGQVCLGGGPDQGQQTVSVPDERFKNVDDARNELRSAGFDVKVRKITGSDRVIAQNPLGQAPAGSTIILWR
jgi:serine/threonine-protein kinase